ncbi:MAG: bifunctional shikimate kinase/3-dehydroquinate synthase [Chloroflexota bacterium]
MKNLLLTGFMATGKSTIGSLIARKYGLAFVDIDTEVEHCTGLTISQIFVEHGEAYFRDVERRVLAKTLKGRDQVVATGGGSLLEAGSRDLLDAGDTVVCLTCTPDALLERMKTSQNRPLAPGGDVRALQALLEQRKPVYDLFRQVDTTGTGAEDVVEQVATVARLGELSRYSIAQARESVITFAHGASRRASLLLNEVTGSDHILVVTESNVWEAGLVEPLLAAIRDAGKQVGHVCLPAGEQSKDLRSLESLYRACMQHNLERSATVLAVGGGMLCDIAALGAATYLRGLRLVLVPTTLLAQVDAAIGGKAAIDLAGAKNLVGAFYPADSVIIDPETLDTLAPPRLSEGLAEVVKIALMRDALLFDQTAALPSERAILEHTHVIRSAAMQKVRVVQEDPFEHGVRALLNFGHTVGHAIEASSAYALSHGEAISIGMCAESWLAHRSGLCDAPVVERLRDLLSRFHLPTSTEMSDVDTAMLYMGQDKKRMNGKLRFALPTAIGAGVVVDVEPADARRSVAHVMGARA